VTIIFITKRSNQIKSTSIPQKIVGIVKIKTISSLSRKRRENVQVQRKRREEKTKRREKRKSSENLMGDQTCESTFVGVDPFCRTINRQKKKKMKKMSKEKREAEKEVEVVVVEIRERDKERIIPN